MNTPPPVSTVQNAWIFITQNGFHFMIRETGNGCWLSEQASEEAITFPSPECAASALGRRDTGVNHWDALACDVPPSLGEWTQILPTSVFNRQVREVVTRYESRAKG